MSDWQPIETAPKNQKVLVFFRNSLGKGRTLLATYYAEGSLEWSDDAWQRDEADQGAYAPEDWYEETETHEMLMPIVETLTHWMPLPEPPKI